MSQTVRVLDLRLGKHPGPHPVLSLVSREVWDPSSHSRVIFREKPSQRAGQAYQRCSQSEPSGRGAELRGPAWMDLGRPYKATAAGATNTPQSWAAQAMLSAIYEPGCWPTMTWWRRASSVRFTREKLRLMVKLPMAAQLDSGETPTQTWADWLLCASKCCVTFSYGGSLKWETGGRA